MNLAKFLLYLFIITSIGTILSVLFESKIFEFVLKPFIIPSIFFLYLKIKKGKINGIFMILLVLNFASDMIAMFNFEGRQLYVIGLNLSVDLFLLYCFANDYKRLNKLFSDKILQFVSILLAFVVVSLVILSLIPNLNATITVFYIFYGIVLSLMTTIAVQNNLTHSNNLKVLFAVLISITFIATDVFYVIYNFYLPLKVFLIVNLASQFLSYFYLIKYFTTNLNPNANQQFTSKRI